MRRSTTARQRGDRVTRPPFAATLNDATTAPRLPPDVGIDAPRCHEVGICAFVVALLFPGRGCARGRRRRRALFWDDYINEPERPSDERNLPLAERPCLIRNGCRPSIEVRWLKLRL